MIQVQFYHLTTSPLEEALPKLAAKMLSSGYRVLLKAADDDIAERLNQALWSFDPDSFLPHGRPQDGNPDKQPLLIHTSDEPLNGANLLFVTDGSMSQDSGRYARIADMFDGKDEAAVAAARKRWVAYKDLGYTISYFSQNGTGGWEQKKVASAA